MTALINLATAHGAFLSKYVSSGPLITFEPAELEAFAVALAARPVTDEQIDALFMTLAKANEHGAMWLRTYGEGFRHIARAILALAAPSTPAEPSRELLRLHRIEAYARNTLATNSRGLDDWRDDMDHIAILAATQPAPSTPAATQAQASEEKS